MKRLVIFPLLAALSGCVQGASGQSANEQPEVRGANDLRIYQDTTRGVVCYRVASWEGLSCLQIAKVAA